MLPLIYLSESPNLFFPSYCLMYLLSPHIQSIAMKFSKPQRRTYFRARPRLALLLLRVAGRRPSRFAIPGQRARMAPLLDRAVPCLQAQAVRRLLRKTALLLQAIQGRPVLGREGCQWVEDVECRR